MSHVHERGFHPYRRQIFHRIFWPIFIFLLCSGVIYYFVGNRIILRNTRTTLKEIAGRVAEKVPVRLHEEIINPEDDKTDAYATIADYFRWVMDSNPLIDDIYTLRPTADPNVMTFVVSGSTSKDKNGNHVIDDFEVRPQVGEKYDISAAPDLRRGLTTISADQRVTYDKWGAWISGYAPLRTESGQAVAIVGVDISATALTTKREELIYSMLLAGAFSVPLLILISLWLSWQISRPFRVLAVGIDRVTHGDLKYRLPLHSGDDKHFVDLFNNLLVMIQSHSPGPADDDADTEDLS